MKFGKCNTDYIFEVDGNRTEGWGKPRIVPYHNFDMHPFNSTIHYSIECFEGLKAYIDANKNVRLFRPELNMERLYKTALTLTCIPFDKNELLKCLEQFILIEKEWIPTTFLHSLYIRPTIISNSNKLILSPPESFKIYIVLTPVGNYFPKGFTAIDLTTEDNFARACKSGRGQFKSGSNYGPTIFWQSKASKEGFDQILWLTDDKHISEGGAMNIFFIFKKDQGKYEIATPMLDGSILPGITRKSIIDMMRDEGEHEVSERLITTEEVLKKNKEGKLVEIFCSGTAAICTPVKTLRIKGNTIKMQIDPVEKSGPITSYIYKKLLGIQYGQIPHHFSKIIGKL